MANDPLYREEILEHYRHPQNFGRLKKSHYEATKLNPLCGDEIHLQLQVAKAGIIKQVGFTGSGCALSIASASMFTQNLIGKKFAALKKIRPQQVEKLLGIKIGLARKKCVLLVYDALREILAGQK